MFSSTITVGMHNTPPEVWDALARVFTPTCHNTTQWIALSKDGATVNFYRSKLDAEPDPQDA